MIEPHINPARRLVLRDGAPTVAALRVLAQPRMPAGACALNVRVYERVSAASCATHHVAEAGWRADRKASWRVQVRAVGATRSAAMAALGEALRP